MSLLDFLQFCHEKSIRFSLDNNQLKVNAPQNTLSPEVVALLRQFKPDLIEWLQKNLTEKSASAKEFDRIVLIDRTERLQLSFGQEQLWLTHKLDDVGDAYHFVRVLELVGELDVSALNTSFDIILQRHEALRTVFFEQDGVLFQKVLAATTINIPFADFSTFDDMQKQRAAETLQQQLISRPFDFARDCMLRLQLIRLDKQHHQLVIVLHHIASDGWSLGIMVKEFQTLYTEYVQAVPTLLSSLPIQYVDYAQWLRTSMQGEEFSASIDYWKQCLEGVADIHNLPTDRPRPLHQSFKGQHFYQQMDVSTTQSLQQLARRSGATLFMVLETLFVALLSRYSRSDDVVIGTPVANRPHENVEGLIGYFVNMVVLRHQIDQGLPFNQLLQQTKQEIVSAFNHERIPFERVVQAVVKTRSTSYTPLIQIAFILQNNDIPELVLPGLTCRITQPEMSTSLFDLQLEITETAIGLNLHWEYATDLFDETTIARMAGHFERLIGSVLNNPDLPLDQLELLSSQERHQQLVEWNDTATDYPKDQCVHALFEEQVAKHPDAIALVFEQTELTYAELNVRANQLAHYLISEKQVKPDTLVGLCVERSLEMVIGILGILKAGGAYVPLDPEYPSARLAYMLEDAHLTTVLTQTHLRSTTPVTDAQALCLDDPQVQQRIAAQPCTNPSPEQLGLHSQHLAYVIYTSGSTGNPKGVMVEQTHLVNFIDSMRSQPGILAHDCLLAVTSTSFDIHGLEIFLPLVVGAKLLVASKLATISPDLLIALIEHHQVSLMQATPATWKMLEDVHWKPILPLKVLCGGEALSAQLAKALLNHSTVELWNMYGPTETTIWSCCKQILPEQKTILMGYPINNTQVFVSRIDHVDLVPVGVAGELLIGGAGVTRGYLNRPELTAEKFIANPFHDPHDPSSSERLYRTGDLVRWLPDGNLEFLGRIDHQVKIRGFRIELGEIENALITHDMVKDAVVLARESTTGDKRLVAYVVTDQALDVHDKSDDAAAARLAFIETLRQHVNQTLPDYMVPAAFMLLESLPLTPNGKVNRKALPEPDASALQEQYVAPRTPLEETLAAVWAKILDIDKVGIHDNFFRLGGHSMLIIQLVRHLKEHDIHISAQQVYKTPTIAELADCIQINGALAVPISQSLVTGRAPLMANHYWFLQRDNVHQWISPIMGELLFDPDIDLMQKAISAVLEHHDGTRRIFSKEGHQHVQIFQSPAEMQNWWHYINLSRVEEERIIPTIQAHWVQIQESVNIYSCLFKVVYFDLGLGKKPKLLFLQHQTLIDPASLVIFYEDFFNAYTSLSQNQSVVLPAKTTSIKAWAEWQVQYAQDGATKYLPYWRSRAWDKYRPFPQEHYVDELKADNGAGQTAFVAKELSREESAMLENLVLSANVQMDHILITALLLAYEKWTGSATLFLLFMNNGRVIKEADGIDLSRTVGWLPNYSKIMLTLSKGMCDPAFSFIDAVREVKDQMHALQDGGLSFTCLRHMNIDPDIQREMSALPEYQLEFTYTPPQAADAEKIEEFSELIRSAPECWPRDIEERMPAKFPPFGKSGMLNGQLKIQWGFSPYQYSQRTMRNLLDNQFFFLQEMARTHLKNNFEAV